MKKYELMYILKTDLDDEKRKAEIEKLHGIITNFGGSIENVNEWGVKDLAYPIKDEVKGYYVVVKLTCDADAINEFTRLAKIDSEVLRHLFIIDQD